MGGKLREKKEDLKLFACVKLTLTHTNASQAAPVRTMKQGGSRDCSCVAPRDQMSSVVEMFRLDASGQTLVNDPVLACAISRLGQ